MFNIEKIVNENMCISCGCCAAVCKRNAISLIRERGAIIPRVNGRCNKCGVCYKVCSAENIEVPKDIGELESREFWIGHYKGLYAGYTKDEEIRKYAVSGGIVTFLISNLLANEEFESAFLVDDNSYIDMIKTNRYKNNMKLHETQGSRYCIISHENTVRYVLEHTEEKVILVGTPCFVQSFINIVKLYNLKRSNYFIIGLFCDRTMNMYVIDYFKKYLRGHGGIKQFYFRSKRVGGWPGGVYIKYEDNTEVRLRNTERMKLKDWLQPERCLYCLDKLNYEADIAVGDNYVEGKEANYKLGANSIIIRTKVWERIWERYKKGIESWELKEDELWDSQEMWQRKNNFYNYAMKKRHIENLNRCQIKAKNDFYIDSYMKRSDKQRYRKQLYLIKLGESIGKYPKLLYFVINLYEFQKRCINLIVNRLKY